MLVSRTFVLFINTRLKPGDWMPQSKQTKVHIIACKTMEPLMKDHRPLLWLFKTMYLALSPHGLTFKRWECCSLCLWHKPTELAHSFLVCSCVCLYGPLNWISFHKFSWHLFAQFIWSYFCFIGPFNYTYLFVKVSLSPDIILCGWVGLKHQLTVCITCKWTHHHRPSTTHSKLWFPAFFLQPLPYLVAQ